MKLKMFCVILAVFAIVSTSESKTYYVSVNGAASWNESANIDTSCSLSTANSNAAAGDTVCLKGGTYNSGVYINPANSGTEDARIVYCNYNDETVTITDADYGILIDGKSYITVTGLNFYYMGKFLYIRNGSNHNIIGYCTFDDDRDNKTWGGSKIYYSSQYNRVHNCTFSRWGYYDGSHGGSTHRGSMLAIGREDNDDDDSFYNMLEDNVFCKGGHDLLSVFSEYNIIRNNYFNNGPWENDPLGYRAAISNGKAADRNLFEGNYFGFSGMSLRSGKNIFRFNLFYENGNGGIQCVSMRDCLPAFYNHIYNNVFYHNGHKATDLDFAGGIYFADWYVGDPTGNVVKNNIFYRNRNGEVTYDGCSDPQIVENNWGNSSNPKFVYDDGTLDPYGDLPDFHLQSDSPCINAGTYLTKITSSSGSGTKFKVKDAWYFIDGFGVIQGDSIQLYGTSDKAVITSIDYQTNEITVDRTISWSYDQGVSLPYEGGYPDIGAYEYTGTTTDVEEESALPAKYSLSQNYPNPFNPVTEIKFALYRKIDVNIAVYNVLGQKIKTLVKDNYPAGIYKTTWNGTNEFGRKVNSGIYIYRIVADGEFSNSKKMVFLK